MKKEKLYRHFKCDKVYHSSKLPDLDIRYVKTKTIHNTFVLIATYPWSNPLISEWHNEDSADNLLHKYVSNDDKVIKFK